MKKRFLMLFMMLLLSALVVTAAGYAWFTASAQSVVQGTKVKAETQGVLKVWTPNEHATYGINQYQNYVTLIDFAATNMTVGGTSIANPFKNEAYTNHVMKDQSGNGYEFYETVASGASVSYSKTAAFGAALVYDLYFSAYTGAGGLGEDMRDIFLSAMSIVNAAPPKTPDLANSVRIAFLNSSNEIFGIYNNCAGSDVFVKSGDLFADNPATFYGANGTITDNVSINNDPVAKTSTAIEEIVEQDTICQINAKQVAGTLLRIVVWFEGTDPQTTDTLLSQSVDISMTFAARMPADTYTVTYVAPGATHSNKTTLTGTTGTGGGTGDFIIDTDDPTGIIDAYALTAAEKPGYTFDGWFTNAELTPASELPVNIARTTWYLTIANITAGSDTAITLYAKFTLPTTP